MIMIMQFKLFLLLIGLCVISYHQATAENEEVPAPNNNKDTESKDTLASSANDGEDSKDEGDDQGESDENEEPNEISILFFIRIAFKR